MCSSFAAEAGIREYAVVWAWEMLFFVNMTIVEKLVFESVPVLNMKDEITSGFIGIWVAVG